MSKGKWILVACLMLIILLIRTLLSNIGIQLSAEAEIWLLLAIATFFVVNIIVPKDYRRWVKIVPILFLALTLSSNYCKKDQKDNTPNSNSANQGNSVQITVPENPSVVTETDWGRLVRFTGREPDGVELYKTTSRGEQFKITLIGEPGIVDNQSGKIWPIWGADAFAPKWRRYFLYESLNIKPNAIVVMFGKPGTAKMEHVCTFDKGETEIIVESPEDGLPLYLYYHEPLVKNSFYCFKNNRGYTNLQIEKLN